MGDVTVTYRQSFEQFTGRYRQDGNGLIFDLNHNGSVRTVTNGHYHGGLSCNEFGKRAIAEKGIVAGYLLQQQRFDECGQASAMLHNGKLPSADCGDGAGKACYEGCNKGAGGK